MHEQEIFEEDLEEGESLTQLEQLKESAPDDVLRRLQKRMRTAQLGKDLVERQAFAFGAVIDAFLKLIFGQQKKNKESQNEGEK